MQLAFRHVLRRSHLNRNVHVTGVRLVELISSQNQPRTCHRRSSSTLSPNASSYCADASETREHHLRSTFAIEKQTGTTESRLEAPRDTVENNTTQQEQGEEADNDELSIYLDHLKYGHYLHGDAFLVNGWQSFRLMGVDLPVDGETATSIWRLFLSAPGLRAEILDYACDLRYRKGEVFDPLYEIVIRQEFINDSFSGLKYWHDRIQSEYWVPADALARISDVVVTWSRTRLFRQFYEAIGREHRCAYDAFVGLSHEKGLHETALAYHKYLLSHGDGPSEEFMQSPRGQDFLILLLQRFSLFHGAEDENSSSVEEPAGHTGYSHGLSLRTFLTGHRSLQAESSKSAGLPDEFTARLFAMQAVGIETIVKGLGFLGNTILRTQTLHALCLRLDCQIPRILRLIPLLESQRVQVAATPFARLVWHFCGLYDHVSLRRLIESNIDHNVLKDKATLFTAIQDVNADTDFMDERAFLQRLFRILYPTHTQLSLQAALVNATIRDLCGIRDLNGILALTSNPIHRKTRITNQTLDILFSSFIKPRKPGHGPNFQSYGRDTRPMLRKDLNFVINTFTRLAAQHRQFPVGQWQELIKCLGMSGNFLHVYRLCAKIVEAHDNPLRTLSKVKPSDNLASSDHELYATHELFAADESPDSQISTVDTVEPNQATQCNPVLGQIFSVPTQMAIAIWGFRNAWLRMHEFREGHDKRPDVRRMYVQGFVLLRQLRDSGIPVRRTTVRKAVKQLLWVLIGPGISKKRSNRSMIVMMKREIKRSSADTMEMILRDIERTWHSPEPLFQELWDAPGTDDEARIHNSEEERSFLSEREVCNGFSELTGNGSDDSAANASLDDSFTDPSEPTNSTDMDVSGSQQANTDPEQERPDTSASPASATFMNTRQMAIQLPPAKGAGVTSQSESPSNADAETFEEETTEGLNPLSPETQTLESQTWQRCDALPNLDSLSTSQRIERSKYLMFALFGYRPRLGGVANTHQRDAAIKPQRVDEDEWRAWVDLWARGFEMRATSEFRRAKARN